MGKHPNAATALAAAQTEFPPITKTKTVEVRTKTGGTYTFDYATHDKIRASTIPVLAAHELALAQPLTNLNGQPAVKTILLHSSGDSIEETFPLPLRPDMTAQEVGSAITYIRRYAWVAMLGLVADDDDDGNHAAGNTVGTASDAAVSKAENPAPVAASPVTQAIQQAQQAQQDLAAPTRPDTPVQIGVGKNGNPKFECVTHVTDVQEGWNGWWNISIVVGGHPRELTTKLRNLIDAAIGLKGTSALVRWTESETVKGDRTYVNRYLDHIEMAEGVSDAFAGVGYVDPDIPFAPAVW